MTAKNLFTRLTKHFVKGVAVDAFANIGNDGVHRRIGRSHDRRIVHFNQWQGSTTGCNTDFKLSFVGNHSIKIVPLITETYSSVMPKVP